MVVRQKTELQTGKLTRVHGNIHFGNILIEAFGSWPGPLAAKLADPGVNNRYIHEACELPELLQWCMSAEEQRDELGDEMRLFYHMILLQRLALQHFEALQSGARGRGTAHSPQHQEYRQLLIDAYLVLQIALLVFHYSQPAGAPAAAELKYVSSNRRTPASACASSSKSNPLTDSAIALNLVPPTEAEILALPVISRAPHCPVELFEAVVDFVCDLSTQTYTMLSSPSGNHIERLYSNMKQLYRNGIVFPSHYSHTNKIKQETVLGEHTRTVPLNLSIELYSYTCMYSRSLFVCECRAG